MNSPLPLEVWGGIECTINRVGDRYFNQLQRGGHAQRAQDLELIADLGIKKLRYPALWEVMQPESDGPIDWSWTDDRLPRLRELGITPILGLLHHGSGPRWTSLLDPEFPAKLSRFAGAIGERYPWIEYWTPVNEPLTTARFSCLYGVWYPHLRDDRSFLTALSNQCAGVAASMAAIRRFIPDAKLVQTEDMAKVFGTPHASEQAAFENQRRWLSLDLLHGAFNESHPLWRFVIDSGLDAAPIRQLRDRPCPPDVIGVNYYATSERLLDERTEHYPSCMRGGNGRQSYVDVSAVRVSEEGLCGWEGILEECWERYRGPIAITESHLGSTRDEQVRWLKWSWESANRARAKGVDVRAVTSWALLGAWDWDSLVTAERGTYEPGAFDVRSVPPRITAVGQAIKALAGRGKIETPWVHAPGWWDRPERIHFPSVRTGVLVCERHAPRVAPLLVAGANGLLARAVGGICSQRGIEHRLLCRTEMEVTDRASIARALARYRPWAVVNAAGYPFPVEAEEEWKDCYRLNLEGSVYLARSCEEFGIPYLTFSTDLVFDGRKKSPYVESDPVVPLSPFGRSKAEAERCILRDCPKALIIRTGRVFGSWDSPQFVHGIVSSVEQIGVAGGEAHSWLTYAPDLLHAALDLLMDEERGLWHLTNRGALDEEMKVSLARRAGQPFGPVQARSIAMLNAQTPAIPLDSCRGCVMPPLTDAVRRYLDEIGPPIEPLPPRAGESVLRRA